MLKNKPIILGIDPGARQIGVAIIRSNELLYYAVKTLKNKARRKSAFLNLEQIIVRLMSEYKADSIALEKIVSVQQRNSFVEVVYRRIKTIAEKHHFTLREYNPKFARNYICGTINGTRQKTYGILAKKYPELNRYLSVTKIWQKTYFAHLFDAVAVALLSAREATETAQLSNSSTE